MEATLKVKKRRKYSKKSKKNLRKYTDIRDVEEFLEEQRFQERTGGLVTEKADEELFCVEKAATEEDSLPLKLQRRKKPLRSQAHINVNLRSQEHPQQSKKQSTEDASNGRREEKLAPRLRALLGVVDSSEEEQDYDVSARYSVRRRREEREVARIATRRLKKTTFKPPLKDIWVHSEQVSHKDIPDEHYLRVTRKLPVKKPQSVGTHPSALDSVPLPPPGASYNPAFDDHQDLLRAAVDVEELKVAADEKLNRKLQMTPMTASERDQVWQEEMMEGIIHQEEEEGEGEGRSGEGGVVPPNKRPVLAENKKTAQQRRRERERREKERQKLALKHSKVMMNDVYRLRSLKKEITQKEEAVIRKEKRQQELQREEGYRTRRLGRYVYEAPPIDVQLSSEIPGALLRLRPEGNLAMERFKNLQKRNMIEPRRLVRKHRKYKLKIKEKRSARLPEETIRPK